MKKAVKVILYTMLCLLVLINIYSLVVRTAFAMPSEMKEKNVCFLAPGLTWDSTISDVEKVFGEPSFLGGYNEDTGSESYLYDVEYKGRTVTLHADRRHFRITELLCKQRVFSYYFYIDCSDEKDEEAVFEEMCQQLIKENPENEHTEYEKSNNELSITVRYDACFVSYGVYRISEDPRVLVTAEALY